MKDDCSRAASMPARFSPTMFTLTGASASGKSATVDILRTRLIGFKFISSGEIFRGFGKEIGMEIEEFAQYNLEHPELDYDRQREAAVAHACSSGATFAETRIPHNIPRAFHILVKCSLEERSRRRQQHPKYRHLSVPQVMERLHRRDLNDQLRYGIMYPDYNWSGQDFDIVLSTHGHGSTPEEIANKILRRHEWWVRAMDYRMEQCA